jgi:hypothetical protein
MEQPAGAFVAFKDNILLGSKERIVFSIVFALSCSFTVHEKEKRFSTGRQGKYEACMGSSMAIVTG